MKPRQTGLSARTIAQSAIVAKIKVNTQNTFISPTHTHRHIQSAAQKAKEIGTLARESHPNKIKSRRLVNVSAIRMGAFDSYPARERSKKDLVGGYLIGVICKRVVLAKFNRVS